jgi:DNA-binding transcriptional LysR family regulator
LTQAGEQPLRYAEKILSEMEGARDSLAQLGKWGHGRLRLGGTTTACQHLIPPEETFAGLCRSACGPRQQTAP